MQEISMFVSSAAPRRTINFKNGIHVWIRSNDYENSHLMILLSFIIQGHPAWRKSEITIFDVCKKEEEEETRKNLEQLVHIRPSSHYLQRTSRSCARSPDQLPRALIKEHSSHAGLDHHRIPCGAFEA